MVISVSNCHFVFQYPTKLFNLTTSVSPASKLPLKAEKYIYTFAFSCLMIKLKISTHPQAFQSYINLWFVTRSVAGVGYFRHDCQTWYTDIFLMLPRLKTCVNKLFTYEDCFMYTKKIVWHKNIWIPLLN